MFVLLVTTPPNAISSLLSQLSGIEIKIIDCFSHIKETKQRLSSVVHNTQVDLIVTYRCPIIIPKSIYSRARMGAINIHPSLLPKYAGLNPWKAMFENGESEGGVTIHKLSSVVDEGEILMQQSFVFPVPNNIHTARDEADRLSAKMIAILIDKLMIDGELVSPYPIT